uniref:Ovule protein n=1 Tax=Gongylonema pulchrum TaxID=637853 RepID=A0A183DJA5_9BILA
LRASIFRSISATLHVRDHSIHVEFLSQQQSCSCFIPYFSQRLIEHFILNAFIWKQRRQ